MLTVCTAGELRHIQKLRFWPLEAVLHDKYLLPKDKADLIASFLTPMLRLHPDKRAKASELVHHAWLDGVIVQGEIDLIRRAEEEELLRREAERQVGGADNSAGIGAVGLQSAVSIGSVGRMRLAHAEERHQLESQQDADALKPVGDIADGQEVILPEEVGVVDPRQMGVMTSSSAQKENAHVQMHAPMPQQGHKHQGSKGVVRIDTGPVLQAPSKSDKK